MKIEHNEDIICYECDNGYDIHYEEDYIMCVDIMRGKEIEKAESEDCWSDITLLLIRRVK